MENFNIIFTRRGKESKPTRADYNDVKMIFSCLRCLFISKFVDYK